MFRLPRRVAPALALLALAATAVPGLAAGAYSSAEFSDVDVYVATVKVPGGTSTLALYAIDYTGADIDGGSSPGAEPYTGQYSYACIRVDRGKLRDFGCGMVDLSAASAQSDLSTGQLKVTVPSMQIKGSRLTADLSFAATGPSETTPDYDAFHSLPDFAFATVRVGEGRPVAATGSITSTKAGGGKVSSTTFGMLGHEKWLDAYLITY